jgi:hypothetical protein
MPRTGAVVGKCYLCGTEGPLTFEHVPPRAAFNDAPAVLVEFQEALSCGPGQQPKTRRIQRRGFGSYTLCPRCNNNTGSWYGPAFVEWCQKGWQILAQSHGAPSFLYASEVSPLRIVKQVLVMFCSVSGPDFTSCNPTIRQFLLDRERRYLDPKFAVYVYYCAQGVVRMWGPSAILSFDSSAERLRKKSLMAEIVFPPYGYVLTIDSQPPDLRLTDISYFAGCGFDDRIIFGRNLCVLPTHLALPGDYRTEQEIWRDYWRNRALELEDAGQRQR